MICEHCDGHGWVFMGENKEDCPKCDGEGRVEEFCWKCNGTGIVYVCEPNGIEEKVDCWVCEGRGVI